MKRQSTLFVVIFLLVVTLWPCELALAGSIVGWGTKAVDSRILDSNDFVAIAAGWGNSFALKSDGSIVGWGQNEYGQANPPVGHDFVAIAVLTGQSIMQNYYAKTITNS